MKDELLIEMRVEGVTLDPSNQMPIVLLKDTEENRVLPIWVGVFEANAIALELEHVETPRPMTHDLIKNIFTEINAKVKNIVVTDLKNNTFYAKISFNVNNNSFLIDSRPSDAIALALRFTVPILVTEKVYNAGQDVRELDSMDEMNDPQKIKKWLENLKPNDFEK